MKKTIICLSLTFILINLLLGLIISAYSILNVVVSTIVIILTSLLLLWVTANRELKNGYKVSLLCLLPGLGFVEYLLAVFMPSRFVDNWCLILIILLMAVEAVFMIMAKGVSLKIK